MTIYEFKVRKDSHDLGSKSIELKNISTQTPSFKPQSPDPKGFLFSVR
jgi:hypothetical protein